MFFKESFAILDVLMHSEICDFTSDRDNIHIKVFTSRGDKINTDVTANKSRLALF